MGISIILIFLMAIASVISMVLVFRIEDHFNSLTQHYIPAYGSLARANIRSLERAQALHRIVIAKTSTLGGKSEIAELHKTLDLKGKNVELEITAAREQLNRLIEHGSSFSDSAQLARLDNALDYWMNDQRPPLNKKIHALLDTLERGDRQAATIQLDEIESLRNALIAKIESIRAEMLSILKADTVATVQAQRWVTIMSVALTTIAATLGLLFSILISNGIVRSVRQLLEGAMAVEAGNLEQKLIATSEDEIGRLTTAFNNMIEQLRFKEHIRATFGKYIDPRIVDDIIKEPTLSAEGQKRVMTILFCDVSGFSKASEKMTPQGLVKIMNRYFTIMSEPIRHHDGVIDKYIGDAIMAYWGPPFNDDREQAQLGALAALDMLASLQRLTDEFPDILGVRNVPIAFDMRIGIATGEALVGSIGSDHMKNYTVIGDTVNVASRLEGACKIYGVRLLVSEKCARDAAEVIEAREIDHVLLQGQETPQRIFEVMGRRGELTAQQEELRRHYTQALEAYRAQDWQAARAFLAQARSVAVNDGPSRILLERTDRFIDAPPPPDWDGVWRLDRK